MAYASDPALPILAHSLLTQSGISKETDQKRSVESHDIKSQLATWSLQDDIDSEFQRLPIGIFQNGVIIGISTLRSQQRNGNDDECTGQFARLLLSAYLHKHPKSPTPLPKAIIIHPATFEGFSPRNLLSSLLESSQIPQFSREDAIACLDSVQLFPVYDIAAAMEAIAEVSNLLDSPREEQSQMRTPENPSEKPGPSVLLIIVGLDTLAEGAVRASNTVRGAAILTTALRSLTRLSRVYGSFLSTMLVNTSGLGSSGTSVHTARHAQQSNAQRTVGSYQEDGIHSIFHPSEIPLLPSLLMRTLDQGTDTHILVSRTRTASVIEVIKDRVGDGLGKWCIWDKWAK